MNSIFLTFLSLALVLGKVYDRCELARELLTLHRAPLHQIATWVCIAEHESQYMTHVVGNLSGDGSGDHGLFQINDKYWCSPPGEGQGCGLSCSKLQDDDISDDFKCVQKIYKEHKKLQGDGFNAWAVYQPHCKGLKAEKYVKNCFDDSLEPVSYNEVTSDRSNDFFNATEKSENFGFSQNAVFDAFFYTKNPVLSSSANYASTSKPSTVNAYKESGVNFDNLFLHNFLQSSGPDSENAAIKFSKPLSQFYYSTVESTTSNPQFPYIDRLAFFNPTTVRPSSTATTATTLSKFSTSQFKPTPAVSTVKTPTTYSSSRFRSGVNGVKNPSIFSESQFRQEPAVRTTSSTFLTSQFKSTSNNIRNPSLFSVSQHRSVPTVSTIITTSNFPSPQRHPNPSLFSVSQHRPVPTVNRGRTVSTFQTSKFERIPVINTAGITSKTSFSNFRPSHLTSTLRPTLSFQTSKSFFVPSPTVSSFFGPSTTISSKTTERRPVFIFNGVKWY